MDQGSMTDTTPELRSLRVPFDVLRETYEEVVACGSQREVAKRHGWHQAKVKHRVESYMRHAGIDGLPPGITSVSHSHRASLSHSGQGDRSAWKRAAARIVELEAEVARLHAVIADLEAEAHPWVAVHARLERIERAVGSRVAFVPDHRRQSDGGRSVKDQRKALRPTG
jgi:hypothetical protein